MLKGSLLERLNSVILIVCFVSTQNYFAKEKKRYRENVKRKISRDNQRGIEFRTALLFVLTRTSIE